MVINISLICYLTGAAVKDRTVIFGYLIAVFISKIVDDVKTFPTRRSPLSNSIIHHDLPAHLLKSLTWMLCLRAQ